MRRLGSTQEWCRFLEAPNADEAEYDLRRHMTRLEEAYAEIAHELKFFSSSPGGEVDETLRVARSAISETLELLDGVRLQLRYSPPDEAA